MRKFYAGKWPTLEGYVLFLGKFEEGRKFILGGHVSTQMFRLVEVINIYHGTFAFDSIRGTNVMLGDFSQNTFDEDSFSKAKTHLCNLLELCGNEYFEAALQLYRESREVFNLPEDF